MREIMKLDVLTKKVVKHLDNTKKVVKVVKAVTLSWTAFTVIATVVSMIPKYEKLKVDGEELIKQCEAVEAADATLELTEEEKGEAVIA